MSLVQSLPFGDARKGITADWMTMGAHTVVQVNVYPTGSTYRVTDTGHLRVRSFGPSAAPGS